MYIIELNPFLDPTAILDTYQKIQEAETEYEKWETKAWYITPEHWGVAIVENEIFNFEKDFYTFILLLQKWQ